MFKGTSLQPRESAASKQIIVKGQKRFQVTEKGGRDSSPSNLKLRNPATGFIQQGDFHFESTTLADAVEMIERLAFSSRLEMGQIAEKGVEPTGV